jgi:septal ring factor EnvC (AmiA/AmiB activator)
MDEDRPGREAEEQLEHSADELEHRIDRLDEHIDDAKQKAAQRRAEADATRQVAGDWEDTEPDRPGGDDPEGAVDERAPWKDE